MKLLERPEPNLGYGTTGLSVGQHGRDSKR